MSIIHEMKQPLFRQTGVLKPCGKKRIRPEAPVFLTVLDLRLDMENSEEFVAAKECMQQSVTPNFLSF